MNLVKLGDICDFFNGGAWAQSEFTEKGCPVLKVSNCKNSGFEIDDVISGWGKSMYGYIPDYGFNYDVIDKESLAHNLEMMAPKLEAFFQGWNISSQQSTQVVPEINVNTTTNVNITITFEQVRSKIEDMTSLTNEQTREALEKISEIESAVKGEGSKKSKWEKIKPILTWLADKSFDVAMTILPLLLQVQG